MRFCIKSPQKDKSFMGNLNILYKNFKHNLFLLKNYFRRWFFNLKGESYCDKVFLWRLKMMVFQMTLLVYSDRFVDSVSAYLRCFCVISFGDTILHVNYKIFSDLNYLKSEHQLKKLTLYKSPGIKCWVCLQCTLKNIIITSVTEW